MKAAVVHSYENPPRYETLEAPTGQVAIDVKAVAISQLTRARTSGKHYSSLKTFPFVPGEDGIGLRDGRRVYFAVHGSRWGSLAEKTVAHPNLIVPVPDEVDDVTAAAIANPGMSSWAALTERAHIQKGESVLINGATGAAGRLAIGIARHLGASRIIVTGRNVKSREGLIRLGADEFIPLDLPEEALVQTFRKHRTDIVLDYLWGEPAERLLASIAGHGSQGGDPRLRYVQIGALAGKTIPINAEILRSSGLELMGSGLGSVSTERLVACIGQLFQAIQPAGLTIAADPVPLAEVEEAWKRKDGERLVFVI